MSTGVMTPSRSTQLSQKRDLKANDIILKTYSIKKHLTLQPHKGKIMQNVYFWDVLELVAKKGIERPKWTTTKSAKNKTQSTSESLKRKDTTDIFFTKHSIQFPICKRLA